MPHNVIYAIRSPDLITEVCGELASAIVQNVANKYHVGLCVYGSNSSEYVHKLQKLTVSSVTQLRISAHKFYEASNGENLDCDDADFIEKAHKGISSLAEPVNSIVITLGAQRSHVIAHKDDSVDNDRRGDEFFLGMGRRESIGRRFVKVMKAFDGNFTVGDLDAPLLSFPISLYPVTRRSTPIDTAKYVNDRRVVQSSNLKAESGEDIDPNTLEKGYLYLNELVTADKGIQGLMNGEYNGAEKWSKAFELLATVPRIPPWITLERTDVLVGNNEAASQFLAAFAHALREKQMNAIVRMCRDPRKGEDGQLKLKGKLELVALQPGPHNELLCSPLPFRDDYKYYYRFYELPTEPDEGEEELDDDMDKLVDSMTSTELPSPQPNALIARVAKFVRDKIADGEAEVPPVLEYENVKLSTSEKDLHEMSAKLMSNYGIHERSEPLKRDREVGDNQAKDLDWDFDFV